MSIASLGTYLPLWLGPRGRVVGDDEDAVTLGVAAGRAALAATSGPIVTRDQRGVVREYDDVRLLRERGVGPSVAALDVGVAAAVAGITGREAQALGGAALPELPTFGASSPLFAIAALADANVTGPI